MLTLDEAEYDQVVAALQALGVDGPALGRPFVDTVKGSRHKNMKELRPRGTHIRLLFAFDPLRQAVVLVAGDKTNRWKQWYEENIPVADERFDAHVKQVSQQANARKSKKGRSS
ncbi:MAG: type II toxin-antitoxin system RelE/ParE family toxin [Actinomycetota bacterium]|nr:type II toxin-antitoxin system RelE/ParE family toxin [Actinomycetota bacterium]